MRASDVPAALRELKQWVCWGALERGGKATKLPLNPSTLKHASVMNPAHWGMLDAALGPVARRLAVGVGFVFHGQGFTGLDLDHCRDPNTGTLEPWAAAIVAEVNSYTEVSPSGTGIHIIVEGKKPGNRCREGQMEIYDQGRYFTFTGQHLEGTPTEIMQRQAELAVVYRRELEGASAQAADKKSLGAADRKLLDRAMRARNGDKFKRLWKGDISGYDSESEATAALLLMLAYWSRRDPVQVDRLFRSSGLMRDKWDVKRGETTWGQQEIQRIIAKQAPDATQTAEVARPQGEAGISIPERTDAGNAEKLMERHGQNIRYVVEENKWFIWDGKRWEVDRKLQVVKLAKEAAYSDLLPGKQSFDPETLEARFKWVKSVSFKIDVASTVIMRRPPVGGPPCLQGSNTQAQPAASSEWLRTTVLDGGVGPARRSCGVWPGPLAHGQNACRQG